MDDKELQALAAELSKGLKTEADLNSFTRMLTKLTVETALNAELTEHLGHEKKRPKIWLEYPQRLFIQNAVVR